MSDFKIFEVASIMRQDLDVLDRWVEFADCLGLPKYELLQYDRQMKTQTITPYELVSGILSLWVSHNGSKAKLLTLVDNLRAHGFDESAHLLGVKFLGETDTPNIPDVSNDLNNPPSRYEYSAISLQNRYKIGKELGKGAFGKVHEVKDAKNKSYALKEIPLKEFIQSQRHRKMDDNTDYYKKKLEREVRTMSEVHDNQHIIQYFKSWFWEKKSGPGLGAFGGSSFRSGDVTRVVEDSEGDLQVEVSQQDENTFFSILMELCETSLERWMKNSKCSFDVATDIIFQALHGLEAMHSKNIAHRDLYPPNLLISKGDRNLVLASKRVPDSPWIKIADFGLARDITTETSLTDGAGNLSFRSPEMARDEAKYYARKRGEHYQKPTYGVKTDIFSLGLVYLLLLYQFKTNDERLICFSTIRGGGEDGEKKLDFLESKIERELPLLRAMLICDPSRRPSAEYLVEVLKNHPDVSHALLKSFLESLQ